ncbi:MAG TPA: hypothetical protein VFH43_09595, partial [Candidatus Kapabacteria bacterium]|nr:hypothetical protein [Candidatus Kapabacteria bacterium]
MHEPQISSNFFEDKEVDLVERVAFSDLSFDVRATNVSVGSTFGFVDRPQEPIDSPELDVDPTFITASPDAVSEVEPMYPSLRGDIEGEKVS